MKKYWFVYSLYWQEGLTKRASFFMERFRSLVVLLSFYYLWSALMANRTSFAGYDRSQMITYVFGMNILRSLVFSGRTDEIAWEINHGLLSGYLLKPVNFIAYTFSRDMSEKSINLVSAVIEVLVLSKIFGIAIHWPQHPLSWLWFLIALAGAVMMNFLLSFIVGCWGFWTAESGGPRFLLELVLEFTAGVFFPLDILPVYLQTILKRFPSPYLVFFPLNVFLERMSPAEMLNGLAIQLAWILAFFLMMQLVWSRGLRAYAAEGS
jgi:ABC-2 type transport system permease protein